MRSLLARLLRRWADDALRRRVAELEAQLKLADVEKQSLELERDSLAQVVERDRRRVQAETAGYAKRIADGG